MDGSAGEDLNERSRVALRHMFVSRYQALVGALAGRLGSSDKAREALHDLWLRLERGGNFGIVRDPFAYLMRSAINIDHQRHRTEQRQARLLESHAEPAPALPDIEAQADQTWRRAAMKRAVADLPERRQAMFIASWAEELPVALIAERFGVSVRTVQVELQRALEQIATRLKEK